jgi:phage terminase small subunit
MSDTKVKDKNPPAKEINLQQQLFIDNYIDQSKDTFNNATQSYLAAYGNKSYKSAQVQASRLLSKPIIQDTIEQLIEELNMGPKVRLKNIEAIITGKHRQETVTTSTDADGKEYTSKTLKGPRASDVIKAVDLVEKITGTYDKNRAKADVVSTELKALIKRTRGKDQDSAPTGKQAGGKVAPPDK